MSEPACGYSGDHGDEGLDLQPFLESALEDVVETVMLYGQWPAPRRMIKGMPYRQLARVQFSLIEWVDENVNIDELVTYYVMANTQWGLDFDNFHMNETKALEKRLTEYLRGTEIVAERAEQLADEAKYG